MIFVLLVLNIGSPMIDIVLPTLYFVLTVIDIGMLRNNFDTIINQKYPLLIVYLSFPFVYLL